MPSVSILIIGGGPAGLALAAGCSQHIDCAVTIVERGDYRSDVAGEHLQSEVKIHLNQLRIPERLLTDHSTPCNGIAGKWGDRDIISHGMLKASGYDYLVDRPSFDKALVDFLIQEKVSVIANCRVLRIHAHQKTVALSNGLTLNYDLLFDCSGRISRQSGNSRMLFDQLIGISFFSDPQRDLMGNITIESTGNGWWYQTSTPLRSCTTFFTDADLYQRGTNLVSKEWERTDLIKKHLPGLSSRAFVRQAYTSILKVPPKEIFQLGDSFYSLDPLSSQGIHKAFQQAHEMVEVIKQDGLTQVGDYYLKLASRFTRALAERRKYYQDAYEKHQSDFYARRVKLKGSIA